MWTVCIGPFSLEMCEEKNIANGTENWLTGTGTVQQGWDEWSDLSWILDFGHLSLDPFAFIEVPSTDTQVTKPPSILRVVM